MNPADALRKASEQCGGDAHLARLLGITQQAIHQWRQVPADRVIAVEKACGGVVTRYELRPDIYPADEVSGAEPERAAS